MLKPLNSTQGSWTRHRQLSLLVGTVVVLSLLLSLANPNWLILSGLAGLGLLLHGLMTR